MIGLIKSQIRVYKNNYYSPKINTVARVEMQTNT